MSRKGFIHVIEVIVITLVVFVLVLQFSAIPTIQTDWQTQKLRLQAYDILNTLDAKGIDWLNQAEVSSSLDSILNRTNVKYELRIANAVRSNISVGCICDAAEYSLFLPSVSSPVSLNGRTVVFQNERINPASPSYSLKHDVIYIGQQAWDSRAIENSSQLLLSYLSNGKGMILSANLSRNSDILVQLLGITPVSNESSSLPFLMGEYSRPRLSSAVAKYFTKLPYLPDTYFSSLHVFQAFSGVSKIDADEKSVILQQQTTRYPGAIARERIVSGRGRAAWAAPAVQPTEDIQHFIRSLILFVSANEFTIAGNELSRPVKTSIIKDIRKAGTIIEPVEISLYLGYTF
ncbi:MAG: hypothetical protein HYX24_01270 [Candidatus Aenigmarchaeota archaeon]|nr:hypothetical protein [Candidatus Aenigmarchaeota archaeon]